MASTLPTPTLQIAHFRYAHAETDRGLQFAALLDRLAAREAERDLDTGLTPAEATAEWAYRARARYAYHRRVASPHNPLRPA